MATPQRHSDDTILYVVSYDIPTIDAVIVSTVLTGWHLGAIRVCSS